MHGTPQSANFGGVDVLLYPVFHPAAALYTRAMLATLQEDFARLPALMADDPAPRAARSSGPAAASDQMDLFS